ncbi:unnamed protein product [Heterobilharzia americana]|nr:unnamed protein product [Heterobilharzia americana]
MYTTQNCDERVIQRVFDRRFVLEFKLKGNIKLLFLVLLSNTFRIILQSKLKGISLSVKDIPNLLVLINGKAFECFYRYGSSFANCSLDKQNFRNRSIFRVVAIHGVSSTKETNTGISDNFN